MENPHITHVIIGKRTIKEGSEIVFDPFSSPRGKVWGRAIPARRPACHPGYRLPTMGKAVCPSLT